MRKNKMMRIASVLLIAVLLTTSVISGTFAKYVTSDSVSDEARVAKFGVVVTGSGSLFDITYHKKDNGNGGTGGKTHKNDEGDVMNYTVESSNGNKLVAPGTNNENDPLVFAIKGTPEVDVRITIEFQKIADVFLKAAAALPDMTTGNKEDTFGWEGDDYYPVVFTLKGAYIEKLIGEGTFESVTGITVSGKKSISGNLAAMQAAFNAINNDGDGIYVEANTNLAKVADGGIGTLELTWNWQFEYVLDDATKAAIKASAIETWNEWKATVADENEGNEEAKAAAQANIDKYGNATAYVRAMWAAPALLEDQQDTLLGDLAAIKYGAKDFTAADLLPATELVDGTDYCLEIGLSLSITVTQVD